MATVLQRTLQALHGHNTAIDLHSSQGGLACAFDILMASQKHAI
jgi:hypothetical protein